MKTVILGVLAGVASGCTGAPIDSDPVDPASHAHASGIAILVEAPPDVFQPPDDVGAAFDVAMKVSADHPTDFAYPWIDRASGEVVVTPVGKPLDASVAFGVPWRSEPVRHSRAALDRIMDDLIGDQPEGVVVRASYPDPENDRIILEVAAIDDAFLHRAARTFDPSAIAIRVVDDTPVIPASRAYDTSPFWGGAQLGTTDAYGSWACTTGFAWSSGSTKMMLIAGHCASTGGTAWNDAGSVGTIASGSEENWDHGVGTRLFPGQSIYRGDIALIRIVPTKSSAGRMYRGGATSNDAVNVHEMWSRSPANGDQFCTGGRNRGELCGWTQTWSAAGNVTYTTGEVARRMWRGSKLGYCLFGGDSGGPIYTVLADGTVAAKGIISGASGGGSDHFAGQLDFDPCVVYFTDVRDAYFALPGTLQTQ